MNKHRTKGRPATSAEIDASIAAFNLFGDDDTTDIAATVIPEAPIVPEQQPRAPSWDHEAAGGMNDEIWDILNSFG